MNHVLAVSGMCASVAGVMILPRITRKQKSLDDLLELRDEELQHLLESLLHGPDRENVTVERIWREIGGFRGLMRIHQQSTLFVGIAIEAGKCRAHLDVDAAVMQIYLSRFRKLMTACLMSFLFLSSPKSMLMAHVRVFASLYANMGRNLESVLKEIDGLSPALAQ